MDIGYCILSIKEVGNCVREWSILGGARLVENPLFEGARGVYIVASVADVQYVGVKK